MNNQCMSFMISVLQILISAYTILFFYSEMYDEGMKGC